jgi:regulator of sirC expression with transglutaminase-like and TPR domain
LQGLGRRTEADQDLRSALEEIESRMPAVVREPSLLMDRGRARELLGQTEAAIQDYRAAAECGGGDEALQAVQRLQGRVSSPWGGLRRGPR